MSWRLRGLIAWAFFILLSACTPEQEELLQTEISAPQEVPTFVGGQTCVSCHTEEATAWRESDHDLAMQVASDQTVLGDFDNISFVYNDVASIFFEQDGDFWIRTDGPSGALENYKITHTSGFEPLQQYLVQLPGGHYQSISIAWDTRSSAEGGQRWFHLYPDEKIDHNDPLHWTGTFQNWNTTCAECHSTNLKKNYTLSEDTFETTWSSIDVDCEACHGPGSHHVAAPSDTQLGLKTKNRSWVLNDETGIASRMPELTRHDEVEVCGQCHARRSQFSDEYEPGQALLDAYRPALLSPTLYHSDGQILGEVFVYGSFLQSAMYRAGVSCSDCHDPHSTKLRASGNALCSQCHLVTQFDTYEHHRHSAESTSVGCIDCHMRSETYMVVDPRSDHSFRVPRPDLSVKIGTPNACNDCHQDQTAQWAANQVGSWYPEGRNTRFHYGEAIHAGRTWSESRIPMLSRVIEDNEMPAIVRATAINLLANQIDGQTLDLLIQSLSDREPLVQLAALEALQNIPVEMRMQLAQRFLSHPLKAFRMDAGRTLIPLRNELSERRRQDLDAAVNEYIESQRFNSDRGEGLFNLGGTLGQLGRLGDAEETFQIGLEQSPSFTPTYVNLSDLYRSQGRENEAERLLREGMELNPDDQALTAALGFSLVRANKPAEALEMLAQASQLAPEEPYYQYILGVALNSMNERERGIEILQKAHERFPGNREILIALATIHRDMGATEDALRYARALLAISPSDGTARALLNQLDDGLVAE